MPESPLLKPVILLTGFAPAPGPQSSLSGRLLSLVAANAPQRADLRTQLLPQDPDAALLKAVEAMDRLLPDAVVGLGVAEDLGALTVERIAVNLDDRGTVAGSGRGEPIDAAGPAAYFSTLPVQLMTARMLAGNIPASVSNSAGTLLSNRLFYALLHYVALRGRETWFNRRPPAGLISRVGFIRIPAVVAPQAGKSPRPPDLGTALLGVTLAIEAVVDWLATPEARAVEISS